MRPGNERGTITTFAIIAALILGMAVVNFVNLTTARAGPRARTAPGMAERDRRRPLAKPGPASGFHPPCLLPSDAATVIVSHTSGRPTTSKAPPA